ncbi:MAG: ATP synthase F1 subunit delta [Rickettsiales bacterium]|nr:MAG: ATP synthase F1 subunit delta [Rickettsiales bacterium]
MSLEIKIIKNYANSLFAQAKITSYEEKIIEEIKFFGVCLSSSDDLKKVMLSPIINKNQKNKIIESIIQKYNLSDLTKYFLFTLVKNSRMHLLINIITEIEHLYKEQMGIKAATVFSTSHLESKELDLIKIFLEKNLNTKVEINQEINKSLLGGIVVKYDSKLIDFSIYGALNKIEKIITHN